MDPGRRCRHQEKDKRQMNRKDNEKAVSTWILKVVKGNKRYIGLLALVQMIIGGASMGYAVLLSGLVDAAFAKDSNGFLRYCLMLSGLVVMLFLMNSASRFLDEYVRSTLENSFKRRLFRNLLYKDYAAVSANHSGDWMSRLTSDTVIVANGLVHIVPGLAGTVVRLVSAFCLMLLYVPDLIIWIVLAGTATALATWGLRKILKKMHREVQVADSKLRVFLTERLNSMMILRAFEQEKTAMEQGKERMDEHRKARMRKNWVSNLFSSGFALAVNVCYVACAVYCGSGILSGVMSYGTFTAVLQVVAQVRTPIANISGFFPQYSAMIASAERLMEVELFAEESVQPAVEDVPAFYQNEFQSLGLRNAAFTYLPVGEMEAEQERRRKVLRNLDMEIHKGEYVAFCGPSGCGKSTVLKLLMCMYALDDGERYVTTADGEVPLTAEWRGLFSYVPQGNQLMSGTIREVVTFGDKECMTQDERIRRALEVACADQFLNELPEGLDTILGERGAGLSEGQMQRIAIARAIFSDRPILLLDEATSALDEETETRLLDNLRSMTDKTVIIVTHRPAALEITDKIITFNPDEE